MMPKTQLDETVARLRERGHRMTPQRMAVLEVIIGNREHLSADQVHDRIRMRFPMTSLATVYKTMGLLRDMGEVLELGFSNGSNRYDGNQRPHPHLICVQCNEISDVDVAGLADLPTDVAQATGYRIVNHRVDFFGICPRCQGRESHREQP